MLWVPAVARCAFGGVSCLVCFRAFVVAASVRGLGSVLVSLAWPFRRRRRRPVSAVLGGPAVVGGCRVALARFGVPGLCGPFRFVGEWSRAAGRRWVFGVLRPAARPLSPSRPAPAGPDPLTI